MPVLKIIAATRWLHAMADAELQRCSVKAGWFALIGGLAWGSLVYAGEIYKWTDDQGRTQISDRVPEKYRAIAQQLDSRRFELTKEQKAEANARAAKEQARLLKAQTDAIEQTDRSISSNDPAVVSAPREATECATLHRLYADSQSCFAPFRTLFGIKAEAFQKCTERLDPSPKCGLAK